MAGSPLWNQVEDVLRAASDHKDVPDALLMALAQGARNMIFRSVEPRAPVTPEFYAAFLDAVEKSKAHDGFTKASVDAARLTGVGVLRTYYEKTKASI